MKVIDVVYYSHNNFTTTTQVIEKHAPAFGYVQYLKDRVNIQLVKHFRKEAEEIVNGVPVKFFKRSNNFWHIPFKTHRYIRSSNPDVVIIEGLIFPLQLLALRLSLPQRCSIVVQHHGEVPYSGYKKVFQLIADRYINAYMFTSKENIVEWIEKKVVRNDKKCYEVLEASTYVTYANKEQSRKLLKIQAPLVFLWVGRLNENKDPLTVLHAFNKYIQFNKSAQLYMIFHTEELLTGIKKLLNANDALKTAVTLVGKVPHEEMNLWYSAADFYISASHKEGSGYALIEALSCGCIPIVTSIPSFIKMTSFGAIGFLYPPADVDYLFAILMNLRKDELESLSEKAKTHFKDKLSFKNIAEDIYNLCETLNNK